MVDKQVHDRFGNLVSDSLADDVKVGRYEGADEFCFQGFSLTEFRIALGGLGLRVRVEFWTYRNDTFEGLIETYKLRIVVIIALT